MNFPANYEVSWHTWSAGVATARNTPTDVYTPALDAAGVVRMAIGPAPTRESEPDETRVQSDIDLFVPPDFGAVNPRDVCDMSLGRFQVVGYTQDYSLGPFNYTPGGVVKLKRVEH
jgi:hypothetical protein